MPQQTEPDLVAGRYRIEGEIARGGMGAVLLAEDTVLGRKVAVKRLHDHMSEDEGMSARFRQEALNAASLTHPNVVTVYDAGEDEGGAYLVMELIEGRTLAEQLKHGALPPEEAAQVAAEVARALDHAHERGIVHRDVKPGNVMLLPDGRVKIADFGIAKTLEGSSTHTSTGKVLGTASYLSPEQVAGKPVTPSSDVYSLGLVLYEMLAGHKAFDGDNAVAVALAQQSQDPPPLPSDVSPDLQAVTMRALEKDPVNRFPTAGEMALALDAVLAGREPVLPATAVETTGELPMTEVFASDGPPPRQRSWTPWVIAAVVAMVLAAAFFLVLLPALGDGGTTPTNTTSPRPSVRPSPTPTASSSGVGTVPTTPPPTTPPRTTPPPTTPPPTTPPPTTPPPTTPPPTTAPPSPTGGAPSPGGG
jgi:serine/threonine-protein kinase